MASSDSDTDHRIRQALTEEDAHLEFDAAREQGVFDMMLGIFQGRLRWLNLLIWFFQLVFMGLAVWSAWRFFGASEVRDHILFATLFLWGVGVTGLFKIWFWMILTRNVMLREVKRLELQVARLVHSD